jgi:hypothetical protein
VSDEKIPPAMTIAEAMALDTSITIETDLAVALVAIKKGRDLIEDCADADDRRAMRRACVRSTRSSSPRCMASPRD